MTKRARLAFVAIVVFQVLFLAGLAAYNEVTLRNGTVVVLQTVPVDPRDLFRGDYVVLRYEISRLQQDLPGLVDSYFDRQSSGNNVIYVRLEQRGEVWAAAEAARDVRPGWRVFLKGRIVRTDGNPGNPGFAIEVEYGIENFFLPEGRGLEVQRAADIKVEASVNGFGKAILKGLFVDGERFDPRAN